MLNTDVSFFYNGLANIAQGKAILTAEIGGSVRALRPLRQAELSRCPHIEG